MAIVDGARPIGISYTSRHIENARREKQTVYVSEICIARK